MTVPKITETLENNTEAEVTANKSGSKNQSALSELYSTYVYLNLTPYRETASYKLAAMSGLLEYARDALLKLNITSCTYAFHKGIKGLCKLYMEAVELEGVIKVLGKGRALAHTPMSINKHIVEDTLPKMSRLSSLEKLGYEVFCSTLQETIEHVRLLNE